LFHNTVRELSSRIPKGVREHVLFLWLQGISRDEIAKIIGIGAGSVSEIMRMYRTNDSDIELEREYMVNVKKQGYNIDQLEPAIRLKNILEKHNLSEEQIEAFLEEIYEHCYKQGKKAEEFIKVVEEFLEKRFVFRKLQMTEKALASVTREKNEAIAYLNRVNNRLDDFILIPKTRKMILKIANDIIDGLLKEFQIGIISNQKTHI
jgi:hypothetical protein